MKENMSSILRRFEDFGEIRILLNQLLQHPRFDLLSKHDPYWQSSHEEEFEKLDKLRGELIYIQDQLSEILEVIDREPLRDH